jgi:ComF family protein
MKKPPSFDSARAFYVYSGTVRRLIHRVKFEGDGYALKALSVMGRQAFKSHEAVPNVPVVPVPLHRIRLRKRGFNQAAALANRLFPAGTVHMELLERTRNTRPQMKLSALERHNNIRGAFRVRCGELDSLVTATGGVILFDDILTTGSTAGSAARALKRAGAPRVDVITVARALRHPKTQLDI